MIKELTTQEINACHGGKEEKMLPIEAAGMSLGCVALGFITLAFAGTLDTKPGRIFTVVALPIMMIVSYNVWIRESLSGRPPNTYTFD